MRKALDKRIRCSRIIQSRSVDRAALAAAAAAAAAAAIRVVGAPSPPPPLSLSGLALRGEAAAAGADGAMGGRLEAGALHAVVVLALVVAAHLRRSLAPAAAAGSRRKRAERGAEVRIRISGAKIRSVRCSLP